MKQRVDVLEPLGDLFIRLLVLAAIPLVFFNLLAGLTALTDVRTFGRLAGKIMGYYVVTDVIALCLGLTAMAVLRPGEFEVYDAAGERVERTERTIDWDAEEASKGGFPHHMLKEIHEQPDVLAQTAFDRLLQVEGDVAFESEGWENEVLQRVSRVQVVACGTALRRAQ